MIDRATIDKIMDAASIVDVVSDFVTLKRAGANLKGLCPFHDDRTPSFMVSPAKNYCKCFACGKGGNPVGFIMEHEQLTYPDALRYLARKYGIPIKEKEVSAEEIQARDDRESMFILNEWARDWFRHELLETEDGRAVGLAYFRGRGFRDDILNRFQVGFSPNDAKHTLADDALKQGYQEKYLVNIIDEREPKNSIGTGLCLKNADGKLRDRFRGRVIWPIFTMSGRVAGFGGRVLDARKCGLQQTQGTFWLVPGQRSHSSQRPLLSGGGLHRRDGHASNGRGKRGCLVGYGAYHRPNPSYPPHDEQYHRHFRR